MLDRRRFLSAVTAGAALTLASTAGVDREPAADARRLTDPELLLALGPATIREIGEAYRALVPAESDRAALESALRTNRTSMEEQVRADFAAGRTIVVRDWVLSRTEARQCALFSLRGA